MRQTRQPQHPLLGFPPALPPCHQAQGLFILTERGLDHGAAVIGIRSGHRVEVGQCRHQHRRLVAPLVLGRPNDPLPRRSPEAVGA
jgi:hypothetical protein